MIKDDNKEYQLDEILTDINRIKNKFFLLLNEMELSGVDDTKDGLWYKVKEKIEELQKDIRKVKQLIKQDELDV